jgi:hypothetical protein
MCVLTQALILDLAEAKYTLYDAKRVFNPGTYFPIDPTLSAFLLGQFPATIASIIGKVAGSRLTTANSFFFCQYTASRLYPAIGCSFHDSVTIHWSASDTIPNHGINFSGLWLRSVPQLV